jgi:tRNA(Ile)-lysidine synthase
MLSHGDSVLLALSGGADSVCLFHLLLELKDKHGLKLAAVHVNHKMRGSESDEDSIFCGALCDGFKVPFKAYEFDAPSYAKERRLSIEEASREKRYQIFAEEAKRINADKVALAHTMSDNAETVLMRIGRGAGVKGLCGIPPVRGMFVRPLIEIERDEVEEHLRRIGACWRTDSSNLTDEYARNRIRRHALPALLRALGPGAARGLARASELAREDSSFLEEWADGAYSRCLVSEDEDSVALDAAALGGLHPAASSRVVRRALSHWSLRDVSREHVLMVASLVGATGKSVDLPSGLAARIDEGKITIAPKTAEGCGFYYALERGSCVFVPELGLFYSLDESPSIDRPGLALAGSKGLKGIDGLCVRSRRPGDRIKIRGVGTVKIKDYFINNKIERSARSAAGLAAVGGDVVMVLGTKAAHMDYEAEAGSAVVYLNAWSEKK